MVIFFCPRGLLTVHWHAIKVICGDCIERVKPFLHTYSFYHIEEKSFRKILWKKVKLLKMSNFTFIHNVFFAICILKIATFHLSSAASLNLGWSQNGVLGNGSIVVVVLWFNATLTAKVISWRSVTHMCFLAFLNQY